MEPILTLIINLIVLQLSACFQQHGEVFSIDPPELVRAIFHVDCKLLIPCFLLVEIAH